MVQSADVDSWSGNLDVTLPVTDKLLLKGELNTGANYATYLGDIGQGVTGAGTAAVGAIRSTGGWVVATLGPWNKSNYNIGYGRQEVAKSDISTGARQTNSCLFGNVFCNVTDNVVLACELSHWATEYKGSSSYPDGKTVRGQISLIYKN